MKVKEFIELVEHWKKIENIEQINDILEIISYMMVRNAKEIEIVGESVGSLHTENAWLMAVSNMNSASSTAFNAVMGMFFNVLIVLSRTDAKGVKIDKQSIIEQVMQSADEIHQKLRDISGTYGQLLDIIEDGKFEQYDMDKFDELNKLASKKCDELNILAEKKKEIVVKITGVERDWSIPIHH